MHRHDTLRCAGLTFMVLALGPAAAAQPFIGAFESGAQAGIWVDDSGFVSSASFDLVTYSEATGDSGHLSDPPGAGWDLAYQDCTASTAVSGSVEGPAAPQITTDATLNGTQNGTLLVSGTPCSAEGSGNLVWDFAFYSPSLVSFGGDFLPIAFNISGEASATGSCSGSGFCGPISTARIEIDEFSIPRATAIASELGPTLDVMDADLVADMFATWEVRAQASSTEGGFAPLLGASGGGTSMAEVNDLQLAVDFALTETLIKAADPTLTQPEIDQGLADLELLVSPGVDVTAFAPQFPLPEPGNGAMLFAGVSALRILERRRKRGRS